MTREEFWMQEFSAAASETYRENGATGNKLATSAAIFADRALDQFDKRFPDYGKSTN